MWIMSCTFIISRNELSYCVCLYVHNVLYVYNCIHEKAIKPSCILYLVYRPLVFTEQRSVLILTVLNFWKFTSYCSLKPLWSGMGEVVPARTSPTLHPPSPPTEHQLSWLALQELSHYCQRVKCAFVNQRRHSERGFVWDQQLHYCSSDNMVPGQCCYCCFEIIVLLPWC